jgi:hypothetical protein
VAALIEGLALATIVGLTGSLAWQAVRVLLVAGLTALAVWGLGAQQRAVRGAVALLLGLTGTVVGIGIGIMHVTHNTLDLTAVAGLACLAIGLMLLGFVRSRWFVPCRLVEAPDHPGRLGLVAVRPIPDAECPVRNQRATPDRWHRHAG